MNARATPPPPPPPPRPPRPAPHPVDPRRPRVLVAAGLVLGMSALLAVPAERVWTQAMVPAADRLHYGDLLAPALTLAGLTLFVAVSFLTPGKRSWPGRAGHGMAGHGEVRQGAARQGAAGPGKE